VTRRLAPNRLLALVTVIATGAPLGLPAVAGAQADAKAVDEADPKAITWLDFEFPPFYVHAGPDEGNGMGDYVVERLIAGLPDLHHRRQTASPTRILHEVSAGRRVCSAAYIRTPERERVMTFSIPDLLLPPNGITVRREALARFGPSGTAVSLATLLGDESLRLGVAAGRSYGAGIDAALAAVEGQPQVYVRQGEDLYESLVQMLVRGRLDYVLGYPYEARYVARTLGLGDAIVNLPLVEAPDYTFAHVVCPKNDWGRALVGRIDAVLRRERPTDAYRAAIERWLDPDMLVAFRKAYADQIVGAKP